jgi:hypothetical protein
VVGTTGQELVSGTRLRAVSFVGADGSKAPVFTGAFWDVQLETLCYVPTFAFNEPAHIDECKPTTGGLYYSEATCKTLLGAGGGPFLGKQLKAYLPVARDGGVAYFLQSTTPYVGPLFKLSSGTSPTCQPAGDADGGQFAPIGAPVSLATMTAQIE